MKKIIVFLCSVLLLSGCTSDKITEVTSDMLLPLEQVAPYLDYTPNETHNTTRRCSVSEYRSSSPGGGDPVIVKLYQPNGLVSEDSVVNSFNEEKELRTDSFDIDGMDAQCYVAYPSIHCYSDGFHIEITAGSGSDNDQKILLMNLAKISLENLSKYKSMLSE